MFEVTQPIPIESFLDSVIQHRVPTGSTHLMGALPLENPIFQKKIEIEFCT